MSELKDGSKNEPSFFYYSSNINIVFFFWGGGLDTLDLNKRR